VTERGSLQRLRAGRADVGLLLVIAFAALVFLTGLGRLPLFGRDEALYAEAAREMHASGDWITPRVNGADFFEKPPLYYWLAALSYTVLGETPLAARLPAALLGIFTVAVTATFVSRVWGRRAGVLAGLMLVTCPLVVMVARMGIMDMPLTCLVALALLAYARWFRRGGLAPAAAFGLLVGLAILLKGLAGGLAPAIAVVHALVYRRPPRRISLLSIALALIVAMLVAAPWFIAMAARHGEGYTAVFFLREHLLRMAKPMQGHGGGVYYYVAWIAFAFFPWVAFLPAAFGRKPGQNDDQAFWRSLAIVWFLVVLIPFSLIKTKLPGYIVPLFPPMAMLVAADLDRRLEAPGRAAWVAVIGGGAILAVAFALLPALAARLGQRYDVSGAARLLVVPAAFWVGGYAASVSGGLRALAGRTRAALAFMVIGQTIIIASLLIGMLPVLSPYLGGGPAHLARVAQRELPDRQIVLYETRPETVAFALRRSVPVFSRNQKSELLAEMAKGPTALIAPLEEREFWQSLPHGRLWTRGLDVLLDAHELAADGSEDVVEESGAHDGGARGR
jgi:4-amino-4-deoxy-L-arabinose transferase-like glycosyltransferase